MPRGGKRPKANVTPKTCKLEGCDRTFMPYRDHQDYCSPKHRWEAWSATHPRTRQD